MTIRVECPNCGAAFKAPADAAGRRAKCRKCGEAFTLRETAEVYALATAEPTAPRTAGAASAASTALHAPAASGATAGPLGNAADASTPVNDTERADKLIRESVAAGVLVASLTAVASLTSSAGMTRWNLIDATLIAALTYGMRCRSRICAVLLLGLWVVDKSFAALDPGATQIQRQVAIGGLLLFGGAFLMGVRGTFLYHKSPSSGHISGALLRHGGAAVPSVAHHSVPWLGAPSAGVTPDRAPSRFASLCGTLSDMLPWNALRWLAVAGGTAAVVVYALLYVTSRWEAERIAFLDDHIADLRAQLDALCHVPAPRMTLSRQGFRGGKEEAEHTMEIRRLTSALDFAEADRDARARSYVPRTLRPVAYAGAGVLGLLLVPALLGPVLRRAVFQD